jgi:hypothetical protein
VPWARLDDDFYDHPRTVTAGNAAVGLWARSLSYCARYLTDGFVPAEIMRQFRQPADPEDVIDRLERAGMMTRSAGGVLIPDFLDYNPSSAQVKADRAALSASRAAAGRRGGQRSGEVRRAARDARGSGLRPIGGAFDAILEHAEPPSADRVLRR